MIGDRMYTIEYEREGGASVLAMWFTDKQLAIACACELLKSGYRVSKVQGPRFHMSRQALSTYGRTIHTRVRPVA